ncbi:MULTISPECIES: hypothetical protein [unclassified Frondihabitans]|uniref:phosphoribosyltransferase-like protein n=1 Tax=unclassified Frondihabitans TaxID=2626248 RepID=UPI000F504C98|nr:MULTISPECIES: hypothetical protein [unclassified Frondihabitans]RPE73813.1 hypothetical protein EDF37_3361 [Frondihabitans sp. PhB153]RPF04067.1 hypothetical protein EDF39_2486 [Frondihabitans sp. PhB161]
MNPKSISETEAGVAWLTNFEPDEVADAAALLDAIPIVSATNFRHELKRLLTSVCAEMTNASVAAFAVRGGAGLSVPYTSRENLPQSTGSELLVEQLLRKTARATGMLFEPSVEKMRAAKVDVVLFVTDNLGSGNEVWEFMSSFTANSSIRSWLSSRHMRFELVAHAISEVSWKWLSWDKRWSAIHYERPGADLESAGWPPDQLQRIMALCAKYADKPSMAYGFKKISQLTVFEHTVGNGLPRILLQSQGPGRTPWVPLLPYDRSFGFDNDAETESSGYEPPRTAQMIIESLRGASAPRKLQKQETHALLSGADSMLRPVLLYLVCLRLGIRSGFQMQRHANMSSSRLTEIRAFCVSHGLIDNDDTLLESGRDLIRKFGRRQIDAVSAVHRGSTKPYYPSQLR